MLRPKPKKCSVCGEIRPLWKSNPPTCQQCHRSQEKPIDRITVKSAKKIDDDTAFYESIWKQRKHYCEECGVYLGDEWKRHNFSHIISKGAHPHLRHFPSNINILCLPCHQRYEFGDRRGMKIYERNRDAVMELLRISADRYNSGALKSQSDPND